VGYGSHLVLFHLWSGTPCFDLSISHEICNVKNNLTFNFAKLCKVCKMDVAFDFTFSLHSVLLWMSVFWASIRRSRPNRWSFPRSEYFSWAWKIFPICFDIDSIFVPLYSADISDDLKDLLFKMLDKNPETRITVPQIKVSMTLTTPMIFSES